MAGTGSNAGTTTAESTSARMTSSTSGFSFTDLMIFRNRWWQHLIFWGVVLFILLNIFSTSSSYEKIDLIYTIIFLVPVIVITYLNLYYFIAHYLRKEKYLLYALFFLLMVAAGAFFLYFLFDRWIDLLLPNYYFISYYSVVQLMLFTGSILLLTTLLKLSRSWFMLLRMERMTTTHQLRSLQSQINPHFLLNSLQTIYALAMEKSERTKDVILQLSEILKYTLYETESSRIRLDTEIAMIRDYVEMYRYRVDPIRADIQMNVEGEPGELQIAPMLLIPFVENSFKHGLRGGSGGAFIRIAIRIEEGAMHFSIENNLGDSDPVELENRKGIGIENTKQRLELLYPGKYKLEIGKNDKIFRVKLYLKLTG
jgi:sensor histidine kinase YesM